MLGQLFHDGPRDGAKRRDFPVLGASTLRTKVGVVDCDAPPHAASRCIIAAKHALHALRGKILNASRGSGNGGKSEEVSGWREGRYSSPSRQGPSVSRQGGRPGARGQDQASTEIVEAVR